MSLPHLLRELFWAIVVMLPFSLLCDYTGYRVALRKRTTDLMEAILIYIGIAPLFAAAAFVAACLLRQPDAGMYAAIGVMSGGLAGAKRGLSANLRSRE